jgi:hypothetical protein
VSYYAYSGVPAAATLGEIHTVTKEGVIAVSAVADPVGKADSDNVGGTNLDKAGTASNKISPTLSKDVLIVAVDSLGGSSVLQARFYVACGEVL